MSIKKNIPNLFTLCNLLCGCVAIVFAFEGNLVWSAYMVGISCVFDFLDGLVARALKVNFEIGKQLDSLADMVSFGVVPGVVMHFVIRGCVVSESDLRNINFQYFLSKFFLLPLVGFCITVFSAIRLAKFNRDARQIDSFIGLPTPANAIFIFSILFSLDGMKNWEIYKQLLSNPFFWIGITFISSFLLIAPIPLFALKFKNFSWIDNKVQYIFLALSIVLLIIFRFTGIPLIIILYIILSIINNLISKKPFNNSIEVRKED